ncbi:MAG: hypothetical protein ACO1OQ_15475 [Rufibacter sp.]
MKSKQFFLMLLLPLLAFTWGITPAKKDNTVIVTTNEPADRAFLTLTAFLQKQGFTIKEADETNGVLITEPKAVNEGELTVSVEIKKRDWTQVFLSAKLGKAGAPPTVIEFGLKQNEQSWNELVNLSQAFTNGKLTFSKRLL